MSIAGSDSSGGAGIQADLKTFTALGVYGSTVVTAVTAQNTLGVHSIHNIPARCVRDQMCAVLSDLNVQAIKVGMLGCSEIIQTVGEVLKDYGSIPLVVDPVMVAQSGDRLMARGAVETLKKELLPKATLITPNIPEAAVLTGIGNGEATAVLDALVKLGSEAVLLKGGHDSGTNAVDFLRIGSKTKEFSAPRINTRNLHGTGCTLSSAIASYLARGKTLEACIEKAKEYITGAIASDVSIGQGAGPVNHLWRYPGGIVDY